ncbi:multidrug effflux MFS transporter [Pseudomarimonas salicorniae]|uniref:Bcr/CflA family efflux transporter n=1 Tax=Pseudomarimonas salicorniae TaxID=2933270 RepID=A0ABT0GGS1_9GAMM|nr:multidrug effflux MFS transporter [Lysobacter sp. CAU 1642]MCK7593737.1 multidrug effflux MFS transporter [Lysobacter sp. CAU 1642]
MPAAPAPSIRRLALLLGALSMFGPFAIDTLFPAFPDLQRDFAASPVAVQQSITAYLVAYALMAMVHGPLSDALGRKPVIIAGALVFALASVGCALSGSLTELLAFRALQGMSAGAGQIVGRAIIRDCVEGAAAQRLMALVSMVFSVAPAIAPIIGGWIIAYAAWPAIFWALAGFAVLLALATWWLLPETHPAEARVPVNARRLAGTNLAILRNRQFLRLGFAGGFNFAAIFIYIASAPAFVLDILRLNAQQFGWFFVPMIAGMSTGAFLSSHLAGRMRAESTAAMGFAVCAIAVTGNLLWSQLGDPHSLWSVLPISLNSMGVAIAFPILMMAILDMYPRQRGGASSMQMVVGLSVNTVVAGALSPWASQSPVRLAACSLLLAAIAWLLWRSYLKRQPACPGPTQPEQVLALEPTDRL